MLIDGVELPDGAEIVKTIPNNKGDTLPVTVVNGTYFELTAIDGANQPGIYLGVSGAWQFTNTTSQAQTYDVAGFISGKPANSAIVLRFITTRKFKIAAGFAGCKSSSSVAATASTVFTIKKNGSSIGTITFAVSGTTGTIAQSGSGIINFSVGDILTLEAPATADATLADIAYIFLGTIA